MGKPVKRARKQSLSRRQFLYRAGLASAFVSLPLLPGCGSGASGSGRAAGSGAGFRHGVASGDPLADRVILWTHLTPEQPGPLSVDWAIAQDPGMNRVVASGTTDTGPQRDYTVKIDPEGLSPDTTYYYQFAVDDARSPIGRTRTLPVGPVERLRFAVLSCASYPHGFFNAYRRVAERGDLNAVIHLGDYIYEYGNAPGQYGADVQAGGRMYLPDNEILSLEDYRTRHALYKLDPDLQAMHQQHPIIAVWDDHETADNAWRAGAANHQPGSEGDWFTRRDAGIRAYYEWMPIRPPQPDNLLISYRNFKFGDLLDLQMLDTRLIERSLQVSAQSAGDLNNPARTLIGDTQFNWLAANLQASSAQWRLLGQQVMFGQLQLAGLPDFTQLPLPLLDSVLEQLPLVGTAGAILNADQWDGYRPARASLFDVMEGSDNIAVLTGDIHTSWAMDLARDPNNILSYNPFTGDGALAVEFVTPSVTSPGLAELQPAVSLIRSQNPHMKYIDLAEHGYTVLDIDRERMQSEWWYVDNILAPSTNERFATAFAAVSGANRLSPGAIESPSEAREAAPFAPTG